jgi:hypothetical protein
MPVGCSVAQIERINILFVFLAETRGTKKTGFGGKTVSHGKTVSKCKFYLSDILIKISRYLIKYRFNCQTFFQLIYFTIWGFRIYI